MKILITGVGITGKSTFRRKLKRLLSEATDIDGDYDKLPEKFKQETLYIIEDVHALTEERCLPIGEYDRIFYLLPDFFSHLIFWLKRVWRWFQNGYGSWDKKRQGWLGSKRRYDPANIPLFLSLMIRDLANRGKWTSEDIEALYPFKNRVTIVRSQPTRKGIKFSFRHKF